MTLTLSAANLKSFIKNSCFDFLAKATEMPFSRRLRRMINKYFLDEGRKKIITNIATKFEIRNPANAKFRLILF
jgi:hypothetical protein